MVDVLITLAMFAVGWIFGDWIQKRYKFPTSTKDCNQGRRK